MGRAAVQPFLVQLPKHGKGIVVVGQSFVRTKDRDCGGEIVQNLGMGIDMAA